MRIEALDEGLLAEARARHDTLTKPPGSLGGLEPLGVRLAGVYGTLKPRVTGKSVAVFAGDHGVAAAGVSAYPQAVTAAMVANFLRGGAAVNALARAAGATLLVVDVGVAADFAAAPGFLRRKVAYGTRNLLGEAAMTLEETHTALEVGMEAATVLIDGGANLLTGGEMGIGNTTAASALTAVFTGQSVPEVTGRGTGVNDGGLERKRQVITEALAHHRPDPQEPLTVLSQVGGFEIAALTGFYLLAASRRVPVLLDGFIATSAALVAVALEPICASYLFASHLSEEPGHAYALQSLALEPLLRLNLRLGEGTGGVLALGLLEGAAAVLSEMATFAEAGI